MTAAQLFQRLHPNIRINTANIVTVTVRGNEDDVRITTDEWLRQDGIFPPCDKQGVSLYPRNSYPGVTHALNREVAATRLSVLIGSLRGKSRRRSGTSPRPRGLTTPRPAGFRPIWTSCPLFYLGNK
ncbi:hypothetical protein BU23DRAFT_22971 [Bimuria novae-zelandiae CBS 107.79]|uniref:Uncharacterized protein n=1 Tax=Bimuria novae-zelandiae CBS 107.79 TaxID=1447943 RepID=A0A6A5ULH2_9PLEO|nr:hypothetical protein BU23DRAFT_22971 [Bimuria novae-zelandiae CBS 107.79]